MNLFYHIPLIRTPQVRLARKEKLRKRDALTCHCLTCYRNQLPMGFRRVMTVCAAVMVFWSVSAPVSAQDVSPSPGVRDPRDRIEERQQERTQQQQERRSQLEARRSERQQQIINRMQERLAAVIDRLTNVADRLRNHVARIRARAQELATNRGANVSTVESALTEAEKHIGLAETGINGVKDQLAALDASDTPRDVAQTFRTGVQSVRDHFHQARANLVNALKALRDVAKSSRPTRGATQPTSIPTGGAP